jgi:hypothetical protein
MTSRALALLAAFASPLFMAAAIAGWLTDTWPANSLTLFVAACAVLGGPVLGIFHVATAREDDYVDDEQPTLALVSIAPEPRRRRVAFDASALTPRLMEARPFHNWRESQSDVLSRREREEQLRRNQRLAREMRRAGRV